MARLEVDIDANIKGLQTSIDQATKVATKLGDPFKNTTGAINILNQRIGILKKNLESATDIKSITSYNIRLKETQEQLLKVKNAGIPSQTVKIDSRDVLRLTKELERAKKKIEDLQVVKDPVSPKFIRATGVINQLSQTLSNLRKNLENATDIRSIAKYNIRIEQTQNELKRLGDIGIQSGNKLSNSLSSTSRAFNNLGRSTSSYNGVGIEFSRIIQDAPFGIMGIGNNITRLAETFQDLRAKSTSTGAAVKTALSSIISPANLLVLGISAVTTAFTLYSMSARSAKTPINELKDAQDEYNESLKETDNLLGREVFSQFLKDVGLLQQQNIGGKLIDVPTFTSAIEVVDKLSGKISELRKGELELLAKFFQTQIAESLRAAQNSAGTFAEKLSKQDVSLYSGLLEKVNVQLDFYKTNTDEAKNSTNSLNKEAKELKRTFEELSNLPIIGIPKTGNLEALRERYTKLKEGGIIKATPQEALDQAVSGAKGIQTDPTAQMIKATEKGKEVLANVFADVNRQAQEFNEMITQTLTNGISNSIADLAFSIGEALATGGNVFSAIGQSLLNSIGNFLGQLGEQLIQVGVAGLAFATLLETIKAGGPAAIPAAIAAIAIGAAMTVAAGAFRGMAGKGLSGGGGGNVSSGGASQSFGGTGIGMDNSSINLNGEFIVRGTDLVYVLSQEEKKRSKG